MQSNNAYDFPTASCKFSNADDSITFVDSEGLRVFDLAQDGSDVKIAQRSYEEDLYMVQPLQPGIAAYVYRTLLCTLLVKGMDGSSSTQHYLEYKVRTPITGLVANSGFLAVVTNENIYLFNIPRLECIKKIDNVGNNPRGICTISQNVTKNCLLAYPFADNGIVALYNLGLQKDKLKIIVSSTALAMVALNSQGTLLAAATENGYTISIYSTKTGDLFYEGIRGQWNSASIDSLNFSSCNEFLCCSSNTETIHVFRMPSENSSESSGWSGYFAALDPFKSNKRAYSVANVPGNGGGKQVLLRKVDNKILLLVTTNTGYLYVFDLEKGNMILKQKIYLRYKEND